VTEERDDRADDVVEDVDQEHEDFDAYWAARERARRPPYVTIRGIEVEAPTDLPIELELQPERYANASTFDEVREYLEVVLGDVVDDLVKAGIGLRELLLLVTWATANGAGRRTTLAQADELLTKAQAADEGKARPNRATRRATGRRTRSGGTSARTGR
jgi:hypothetical protein